MLHLDHRQKAKEQNPPTLVDCGCVAFAWPDGSGIEIEYCPFHQDAPQVAFQLMSAINEILEEVNINSLSQNTVESIKQATLQVAKLLLWLTE